LVTISLVFGYH